jgi:hypothetical protein
MPTSTAGMQSDIAVTKGDETGSMTTRDSTNLTI